MTDTQPTTELDERYSDPSANPTDWTAARRQLEAAETYWITTVREDGRPHTTPLIAVWVDDALHFCTGPEEQKAKNLSRKAQCSLITGCNTLHAGLDLVIEGEANVVRDDDRLRRIAEAYEAKYGAEWRFEVRNGAFFHEGHEATVYAVAPTVAYAYAKGVYSHTRFRFGSR